MPLPPYLQRPMPPRPFDPDNPLAPLEEALGVPPRAPLPDASLVPPTVPEPRFDVSPSAPPASFTPMVPLSLPSPEARAAAAAGREATANERMAQEEPFRVLEEGQRRSNELGLAANLARAGAMAGAAIGGGRVAPEFAQLSELAKEPLNTAAIKAQRLQGMMNEKARLAKEAATRAAADAEAKAKRLMEANTVESRKRDYELSLAKFEQQKKKDLADAAKTAAEGKGKAGDQLQKVTTDLRQEFQKQEPVKQYGEIKAMYKQIESIGAQPRHTPANDMSMVFAYMKLLDPKSSVREGEQAQAGQTTGVPGQVVNAYNAAVNGTKLSTQQIKDFVEAARSLFMTRQQLYDDEVSKYSALAERLGMSVGDVVLPPPQPPAKGGTTAASSTPAAGSTAAAIDEVLAMPNEGPPTPEEIARLRELKDKARAEAAQGIGGP